MIAWWHTCGVRKKKEKHSFTLFLPPPGFFTSIKEDEDTSDSVIVSLFYHIFAAWHI